jgi:hypothetical protein
MDVEGTIFENAGETETSAVLDEKDRKRTTL